MAGIIFMYFFLAFIIMPFVVLRKPKNGTIDIESIEVYDKRA